MVASRKGRRIRLVGEPDDIYAIWWSQFPPGLLHCMHECTASWLWWLYPLELARSLHQPRMTSNASVDHEMHIYWGLMHRPIITMIILHSNKKSIIFPYLEKYILWYVWIFSYNNWRWNIVYLCHFIYYYVEIIVRVIPRKMAMQ